MLQDLRLLNQELLLLLDIVLIHFFSKLPRELEGLVSCVEEHGSCGFRVDERAEEFFSFLNAFLALDFKDVALFFGVDPEELA